MARAIWTGAPSFGLVNVPVRMYPVTSEKQVRSRRTRAERIDALRKAS